VQRLVALIKNQITMKKTLLSIFMLSSINLFGQQQISNGDLELWQSLSFCEQPSSWLDPANSPGNTSFGTNNYLADPMVLGPDVESITTMKISGSQAAGGVGNSVLLETKAAVGQTLLNMGITKISGLLSRLENFTGQIPLSLSLDIKPQVLSGDTAYVYVEFRDASDNIIKYAYQEWTNNTNSWQNVTVPIIDFNPGVVSKLYIGCVSSYSENGTEVVGSKLYLDNFTFNYPCQVDNEVYLTNMAFYSSNNASSQMGATGYDLPSTLNPNSNNLNNFLDIGKPIRFKIKCKNTKQNGQSIVSGQCRITTSDPNIQLIDSLSGLNNVGWNSDGWSTDEFEIKVSSSVTTSYTAYVDFIVIENGIEYVTPCVPIPVKPFTVSSYSIDDDANPDSQGDGDQITEPNETIEVLPLLNNTSEFDASLVKGFFLNLDNYSGINIWNNVNGASGLVYNNSVWNYSFGQPQPIPAGTTNSSPQFDFVFDYNLGSIYSFDLYLATHGGFYLFGNSNGKTLIRTSNKLNFNPGNPMGPISGADVKEETSNLVSVYPNPTTNYLIIETKKQISSVDLVDEIGKSTEIKSQNGKYNLENISYGLYTLRIISKDGEIITEKVVVQK
jgi:hypothetical protein